MFDTGKQEKRLESGYRTYLLKLGSTRGDGIYRFRSRLISHATTLGTRRCATQLLPEVLDNAKYTRRPVHAAWTLSLPWLSSTG